MKSKWVSGRPTDTKADWGNLTMFKRRPAANYSPSGTVLLVPKQVLQLMWQGLACYHNAEVEGCCFWYGPKTDLKEMPITHLVFPKQVNNRRNFMVTSDAIAEMSTATRPLGMVNRAQVHTHPGRWVGHSPYDDDNAISRKALSIVLPRYGATIAKWPKGIGVHEFGNEVWQFLSPRQASRRIRLVEAKISLIDLR